MKLPTITLTKDSLSHFNEAITKEWLVTNGLGSYASSTVLGINTRKYHGLLVAALNPPRERTVCVVKLDEDIIIANDTFRLGANDFNNKIFPEGHKIIEQFSLTQYPIYKYDLTDFSVKKTIFLPQLKNALAILYNFLNKTNNEVKVRFYPLLTCRHYHTVLDKPFLQHIFIQENNSKDFQVTFNYPQATINCQATDGQFFGKLNWVENLHYREEHQRGEACIDSCFQPGFFELFIPANSEKKFAITCAVSQKPQETKQILDSIGTTTQEFEDSLEIELNRKLDFLKKFSNSYPSMLMSEWLKWLLLATNAFIVQNINNVKSIIAGYHWFGTWGRDAFISFPGLLLVTGRYKDAKNMLLESKEYLKDGLIPNFFNDKTGEPAYNSVDGTLWYINSVLQFVKYTGDFSFVQKNLWDNLQSIIERHQKGTIFDIRQDSDGLLMHGPQLTWMDAALGNETITPRAGKAVEIQALWYNSLRTMELFASKFGDPALAAQYSLMANLTHKSFNEKFLNVKKNCLFDVLKSNNIDESIRPNQIFSVSLDYTMPNKEISQKIVNTVNRELVTSFGLRTLSADDPKFVSRCIGDRHQRDKSYHNGAIWPWLIGPHITAYLKVNEYSLQSQNYALNSLFLPLLNNAIYHGGLGMINEIYDCESLNTPLGCIAQAWSIAEPLRAYVEDILQIKPKLKL